MSYIASTSRLLLKARTQSSINPTTIQQRLKHSVRVIITRDLPEGQMRNVYAGEVHNVAAGYARNYLMPKKMAVYATADNFKRCGLIDPKIAEKEGRKLDVEDEGEELKAADRLKKYLKNKSVKMTRNVDLNIPNMCHPGHVSAKHLRQKLSKQLKIDLEPHESIHIMNESVVGLFDMGEKELMDLITNMEVGETGANANMSVEEAAKAGVGLNDCNTQLKYLGDYVAKITLAGDYIVPLKFSIGRR